MLKKYLSRVILFLIFLITFLNVPMLEIQLLIFGSVPISNFLLKGIVLSLIISFSILFQNDYQKSNTSHSLMLFLCLFLLLILPLIVLFNTGSINNYLTILGQNYIFYFFALFFSFSNPYINFKKILHFVIFVGLLNSLICFLQYSLDSILYPFDTYPDGTPIFNSIYFYDSNHTIRAFGICTSGFDCGVLLCFTLIYFLNKINFRISFLKNVLYCLLVILIGYSLYATKTRNAYLLLAFCLAFWILFKIIKSWKMCRLFMSAFPVMVFIAFISFFVNSSIVLMNQNSAGVFNVSTILIRFEEWNFAFYNFKMNYPAFIFGFGQSQTTTTILLNDNIYIDFIYTFGLLGLTLFLVILIFENRILFSLIKNKSVSLLLYLFSTSVFIVGLGNLTPLIYGFLSVCMPILYISKILGFKTLNFNKNPHFIGNQLGRLYKEI